jgi:hypothetical protein
MAELVSKLKDSSLAKKYGLKIATDIKQMGRTQAEINQYLKDLEKNSNSTSITGDPKRMYEKMLAKSSWYYQDVRDYVKNVNAGRVGNYGYGQS